MFWYDYQACGWAATSRSEVRGPSAQMKAHRARDRGREADKEAPGVPSPAPAFKGLAFTAGLPLSRQGFHSSHQVSDFDPDSHQ